MKLKHLRICDGHELNANPLDNGRIELCIALAGEWKSRNMKVTPKHLQEMMDDFTTTGRDILFDIDHKSLGGFLNEADSRAAGWGKSIRIEDGKMYVEMEPTALGKSLIENGEYRYLSPVYQLQRSDRVTGETIKTWRLHSVALTNTPFLTELPAIKNHEGVTQMDELLKLLGVTDEDAALAKVRELKANSEETAKQLKAANDECIDMQVSLAESRTKINAMEVDAAIANQQLLPAQREFAMRLINKDREAYDLFLASLPKVDLTNEVPINSPNADTGNPLDKVTSFKQLMDDPALDAKMLSERPDRHDELFKNYMKEEQ